MYYIKSDCGRYKTRVLEYFDPPDPNARGGRRKPSLDTRPIKERMKAGLALERGILQIELRRKVSLKEAAKLLKERTGKTQRQLINERDNEIKEILRTWVR